MPDYAPSEHELTTYEGEYFSEELQVVYRIGLADGQLALRVRAEDKGAIDPLRPDVMLSQFGTMRFQRNHDGAISGFRLDAGRVRDVSFERQQPAALGARDLFRHHFSNIRPPAVRDHLKGGSGYQQRLDSLL